MKELDELIKYLGIKEDRIKAIDNIDIKNKSLLEIHKELDNNIDISLRELQLLAAIGIRWLKK